MLKTFEPMKFNSYIPDDSKPVKTKKDCGFMPLNKQVVESKKDKKRLTQQEVQQVFGEDGSDRYYFKRGSDEKGIDKTTELYYKVKNMEDRKEERRQKLKTVNQVIRLPDEEKDKEFQRLRAEIGAIQGLDPKKREKMIDKILKKLLQPDKKISVQLNEMKDPNTGKPLGKANLPDELSMGVVKDEKEEEDEDEKRPSSLRSSEATGRPLLSPQRPGAGGIPEWIKKPGESYYIKIGNDVFNQLVKEGRIKPFKEDPQRRFLDENGDFIPTSLTKR
jgi:hypothetical protein